MPICLPPSLSLFFCLSIYFSVSLCLSVCLSVRLSVCLSFYLSVCLSVCQSVCLSGICNLVLRLIISSHNGGIPFLYLKKSSSHCIRRPIRINIQPYMLWKKHVWLCLYSYGSFYAMRREFIASWTEVNVT